MTKIDVLLVFALSDFDEDGAGGTYDSRCQVLLEPLENNLFRVSEPTSLTPFGPLGPSLSIGQIIEAEPLTSGVWTYVRTHSTPLVWSHTVSRVTTDALNQPPVLSALDRLYHSGCGWEWTAGNLTLQCLASERNRPDVDKRLSELFQLLGIPEMASSKKESVPDGRHRTHASRGGLLAADATEAVIELARRGNLDCSADRALLKQAVSRGSVAWRGGIRVTERGSLAFVESPSIQGVPSEIAARIAQITGTAYHGFFDAGADGLPLTRPSKIEEWFEDSLSANYPEASPTFLRFATTYWTMKVLIREADLEPDSSIAVEVLRRLDDLIAHLFFPYEGPLIAPPDRREADQRMFLAEFGPRIDAEEFMAGNPIIIRDRKRYKP